MTLYQLPLLTADEVTVLRHGLRCMVPDVPGPGLWTVAADDLRRLAWSLDTALAEASSSTPGDPVTTRKGTFTIVDESLCTCGHRLSHHEGVTGVCTTCECDGFVKF